MKSPIILITPLHKADTEDVYLQKGYLENLKTQGPYPEFMANTRCF